MARSGHGERPSFSKGSVLMKTDDLADLRESAADQPLAPLSPRPCVSRFVESKRKQNSKIQELGEALADAGFRSLDERARVLDLSRSTTWTILKSKHKSSGLSA